MLNFHIASNSASFKFKQKITHKTADCGKKDVEIMLPVKYFGNFGRILEMPLVNSEINLILTRSDKRVFI